jgi:hypothetical protein
MHENRRLAWHSQTDVSPFAAVLLCLALFTHGITSFARFVCQASEGESAVTQARIKELEARCQKDAMMRKQLLDNIR